MRRVWLMGLALVFLFGSAAGVDKKGKIGLGFFNDEAPIGGRYWITDQIGLDLGFGIHMRNVVDSTVPANLDPLVTLDPSKKSLAEIRLDAGIPFNLIRTEKVNFLIRPGLSFEGIPFFNLLFRDSIQKVFVFNDTVTVDDTLRLIGDTLLIPSGQVLDTVTNERSRSIDVNLTLGIEYFPAENFSVSLFHGIGARNERRTKNGESFWTVTHRPFFRGTNIGFHFYF